MSYVDALLDLYFYRKRRKPTISHTFLAASAGATTTLVAAPGAGRRIMLLDGMIDSTGAGSHQWYHTAVDNANRITGPMAHTNNESERVGPFLLPANTPLLITATTTAANGWIAYTIAEEP